MNRIVINVQDIPINVQIISYSPMGSSNLFKWKSLLLDPGVNYVCKIIVSSLCDYFNRDKTAEIIAVEVDPDFIRDPKSFRVKGTIRFPHPLVCDHYDLRYVLTRRHGIVVRLCTALYRVVCFDHVHILLLNSRLLR